MNWQGSKCGKDGHIIVYDVPDQDGRGGAFGHVYCESHSAEVLGKMPTASINGLWKDGLTCEMASQ